MKKIKVIIVDDSLLLQKALSNVLNSDPEILVVGLAENPLIARQIIKALNPDVLILDIDMPEMDGITFLEKLMRLHPMPVIMCSAFTPDCHQVTLEVFKLGVIDIISKPILKYNHSEIIEKVKNAASAKMNRYKFPDKIEIPPLRYTPKKEILDNYVFAIGASTGGTQALKEIFQVLPENVPPIVVTQHLPQGFSAMLARGINEVSALEISEAKHGEVVLPGHVYIAPAGSHLELEAIKGSKFIKLSHSDPIKGHKPSIDVMMESVAKTMGNHSVSILLSGMGSDGANGMLAVKNAGGITIAQDEKTSVIWGMPKVAIDIDAVKYVLPLQEIPEKMLHCLDAVSN